MSWIPAVANLATEVKGGGEKSNTNSNSSSFEVDAESAVKEALAIIRDNSRKVVIIIDDFHFVVDENTRRSIILALRPLLDIGVVAILSTILGGRLDPAFHNTNAGGRRQKLVVTPWKVDELEKIATQGFNALQLWVDPELIRDLAEQSFGSPQIMQLLLLNLARKVNNYRERDQDGPMDQINPPANREDFFRSINDDEASEWFGRLAAGPNPRKARRRRTYPTIPPVELDGYQLILQTLHELGSPTELKLSDLKNRVSEKLNLDAKELNKIALEQKARNLGLIASRDTTDALNKTQDSGEQETSDDEVADEEAVSAELIAREAIPQPVFEVKGKDSQASIAILDPLLSYMIKWHPHVIVESGRA